MIKKKEEHYYTDGASKDSHENMNYWLSFSSGWYCPEL